MQSVILLTFVNSFIGNWDWDTKYQTYFTEEAPVVISLPHLYQVDPVIQDTIEGLNPVKEMHETAIDVEPVRNVWRIQNDGVGILMY